MIEALIDGYLHWTCLGMQLECQMPLSAHISEAEYKSPYGEAKGSTIVLPPCSACGGIYNLKADYTLKELFKETVTFVDNMGNIKGYGIPFTYTRNLLIHHMLFEMGKAEHAPVLPMPGKTFLEIMAPLGNPDLAYSLWFSWALLRERGQMIAGFDQFFLGFLESLPLLKGGSDANQINS
jgi:hypothetical protein